MVIRSILKQSPSDVMQIIKSITVHEFFSISAEIKKNIFGLKIVDSKLFFETIGNVN